MIGRRFRTKTARAQLVTPVFVLVATQEQQCATAAGWRGGFGQATDGSLGTATSTNCIDPRQDGQLGPECGPHPQQCAGQAQVSEGKQHNSSQRANSSAEQTAAQRRIGGTCESTLSDAHVSSPASLDADSRYIVRFREYRSAGGAPQSPAPTPQPSRRAQYRRGANRRAAVAVDRPQ